MKTRLMSGLMWSLLAGVLFGSRKVEDLRRNYSTLDPEANAVVLAEKRLELELRRPGGPRREAVTELLRGKIESEDRSWTSAVLDACQARLVDCNDYVGIASKKLEGLRGRQREVAEYDRGLISKEAVLQRMTVRARHALYEQAISNISATVDGVKIYDTEAARQILSEGFVDLVPLVRRKVSGWRENDRLAASPYLEVAEAAASVDTVGALVRLVRASAESEIAGLLNPNRVVTTADEVRRGTARVALRELRRLNRVDSVDGLKGVLELYEPVRQKYLRIPEEIRASGRSVVGSEVPSPTAYLGFVGWETAEAIGDLGDRDFERKTLGGRTLWDQVSEAEKRLVREGKLRQSEVVSK